MASIKVNKRKKPILLAICGPSGSGKTYLMDSLEEEHPDIFTIMPRVTTREPREGEDDKDYLFLNETQFEMIESVLIGKCDNFYGAKYGTIKTFLPNKINMGTFSVDGLRDMVYERLYNEVEIFPIMLEIKDNLIKRKGRDENSVMKEFLDIKRYVKTSLTPNEGEEYIQPEQVIKLLQCHEYLI